MSLGVMKKLLLFWIHTMGKSKSALLRLSALNNLYKNFTTCVPVEIARKPRSFDEVTRWKATEFRLILLYFGPVVLQSVLSKPQIIHFNALNCAVRILCDPRQCIRNNKYAHDLMVYFVDNMKYLYGENTIIYNVHNLIHISADVLNFRPLDSFSCFPFENFLQKVKQIIKSGANPLAQVMKRITERSQNLIPSNNIKTGYHLLKRKKPVEPLFEGYSNPHGEIEFSDFVLTDKFPNNCCYLLDESIVLVEGIGYRNEIPVIGGRKCINLHSITDYPIDSRMVGVCETEQFSEKQTWTVDQIDRKGVSIPHVNSLYMFFLVHSD